MVGVSGWFAAEENRRVRRDGNRIRRCPRRRVGYGVEVAAGAAAEEPMDECMQVSLVYSEAELATISSYSCREIYGHEEKRVDDMGCEVQNGEKGIERPLSEPRTKNEQENNCGCCLASLLHIALDPHNISEISEILTGLLTMECLNGCSLRKLEWEHRLMLNWNSHADRLHVEKRSLGLSCFASGNYQCSVKVRFSMYPVNRYIWRHSSWRAFAAYVGLDEEPSSLSQEGQLSDGDELAQKDDASDIVLPTKLGPDELKWLLADSERAKLIRKLSEANRYNRFLKRQLQTNDTALVNIEEKLAALALELEALVALAEEVANSGVQPGTRKINGKYIHSHLVSRLEAINERVKQGVTDADSVKVEEITLYWIGMAESVQVMGSFDGWSLGEEMSPEYSGDYARFSTTLKLRPGRYEIKFLIDGEWHLSPELPTVGEGLLKNNLLIV
ncbi:hypothetical protein J5N97_027766 [Dioscorea zingiberensis]|uniref:AMP-activated protein kinase glycogen-binding domain-containing protein n=1 Tax=Dioscorea zingiberensis TaxID=325984 RepID=A0A9D5H493_9LILI|nr:hypothetical protein J5N97_027766 [Dioscorea zingiberensis]